MKDIVIIEFNKENEETIAEETEVDLVKLAQNENEAKNKGEIANEIIREDSKNTKEHILEGSRGSQKSSSEKQEILVYSEETGEDTDTGEKEIIENEGKVIKFVHDGHSTNRVTSGENGRIKESANETTTYSYEIMDENNSRENEVDEEDDNVRLSGEESMEEKSNKNGKDTEGNQIKNESKNVISTLSGEYLETEKKSQVIHKMNSEEKEIKDGGKNVINTISGNYLENNKTKNDKKIIKFKLEGEVEEVEEYSMEYLTDENRQDEAVTQTSEENSNIERSGLEKTINNSGQESQESSTTEKMSTTLPSLTDDELLPENEQSVEQTTQFSGTETFSKKIAVIS